jgi:hypothetical protein
LASSHKVKDAVIAVIAMVDWGSSCCNGSLAVNAAIEGIAMVA